MTRRLAANVYVAGELWPTGSQPPADVAGQITNPKAWEPDDQDEQPDDGDVTDEVPAWLSNGEFVEPVHATTGTGPTAAEGATFGGSGGEEGPETGGWWGGDDPDAPDDEVVPISAPGGADTTEPGSDRPPSAAADLDEPPRGGAGSSLAAWSSYADAIGVTYEPGASRDEIIAAVDRAVGR